MKRKCYQDIFSLISIDIVDFFCLYLCLYKKYMTVRKKAVLRPTSPYKSTGSCLPPSAEGKQKDNYRRYCCDQTTLSAEFGDGTSQIRITKTFDVFSTKLIRQNK